MALLRALAATLLAALPAAAQDPPDSVAALSWELAEVAVDLGLPLMGIADTRGYAAWVGVPPLPEGVVDLGLRTEPNLEAISALSPGLILGSDQQASLAARLSAIAPTQIVDQFAADQDADISARRVYRETAARFGKSDLAETRLAEIDARMAAAGDRVRAAWGGDVPPVLPVRLLTATSVRIHAANSMVAAALRGMGLAPADPARPGQWGFTLAPIEALAGFPDAAIIHFDPFAEGDRLYASPLWQAIPAVAAGRFAAAGPAWTFGSVVSLETLAARFEAALVAMAPS